MIESFLTSNANLVDKIFPDNTSRKTAFSCYDVEILSRESTNHKALAFANLEKQRDLLYIKFKLAHEGSNKNRDGFTKKDLKAAAKSPIYKSINWDHGEPVIGVIYASEFVDPSEGKQAKGNKERSYIVCEAAIWKFRNPDLARKIINRYTQGTLMFSMEAYFNAVECSVCRASFNAGEHEEGSYCEHLNRRFDSSYAAATDVTRYLKDFVFGAAGVVEDPADIQAEALALAAKNIREEASTLDEKYTQAELDAKVKEAVANALKEASATADTETLKVSLDDMKAQNETLTTSLNDVKATLETVTQERDGIKAEFESFKTQVERDKLQNTRLAQLSEAGISLPEEESEKNRILNTVMSMPDEAFTLYVETVKSAKSADEKSENDSTSARNIPATGSVSGKSLATTKPTDADKKPFEVLASILAKC